MKPLKLLALEHKYSYPNNGDEYINDIKGFVPGALNDESQHENQHTRENDTLDEIKEDDEKKLENDENKDQEKDEEYSQTVNEDDMDDIDIKKHKHKHKDIFTPHPFYQSQYGYTGFEGAYTSPLEYYSGSISEEPGAITNNPYNNTYQSSSIASRIERIKIRAMIFTDMISMNNSA